MYVCIHIHTYSTYIYIYIYIHIHTHIHTFIRTYIHTNTEAFRLERGDLGALCKELYFRLKFREAFQAILAGRWMEHYRGGKAFFVGAFNVGSFVTKCIWVGFLVFVAIHTTQNKFSKY